MAAGPSVETLRDALRGIADPDSGRDIVSAGLIEGIELRGGLVQVALRTDRAHARAMEPVRRAAEAALAAVPGIANATAVLTAHTAAPPNAPSTGASGGPAKAPPPGAGPNAGPHAGPNAGPGHGHGPRPKLLLDGVRHIVAVASGKGGVGKSTVAVNIAVALARQGHAVGLLDADIYGPSLPRMLGVSRKPEVRDGKMLPLPAWGLQTMSIGFLVEEETPMIWRGPMVMGALEQMLSQVLWGALDVLVIDMPPGTGDAQLTIAQRVALAGAVIVSTPQDIALLDARRGVRMFERVNVPVLGLVENMSVFCCPNCGHRSEIFGHGGARAEAQRLGAAFLGEVPLLLDIRTSGDAGTPIVAAAPDGDAAKAYDSIAAGLWKTLTDRAMVAPPRIVID
jgi:ATP-binding protein involved in chromosome partitioning